jgi:hypothetical protein
MQANPDKFQAIAVGNKTYAKKPVFNIESAVISCDEVVKLLGIDIDYQLNFNNHIKNIVMVLLLLQVIHHSYSQSHHI